MEVITKKLKFFLFFSLLFSFCFLMNQVYSMKRVAEELSAAKQKSECAAPPSAKRCRINFLWGLYFEGDFLYKYNEESLAQIETQVNDLIKYDPSANMLNLDPQNPEDLANVQKAFTLLNKIRYGTNSDEPYEPYFINKPLYYVFSTYSNFCEPQYQLMKKFYQIVVLLAQTIAPTAQATDLQNRNRTLINFGETCYLNSVVQCLSNISLLRIYLFANQDEPKVTSDPVASSFIQLLPQLRGGKDKIRPTKLKNAVIQQLFSGENSQHDAQQLLIGMLDHLIKDQEQNPFGIILERILTCPHCSFLILNYNGTDDPSKAEFENMISIQIPMPKQREKKTLQKCLANFTEATKLTLQNMWECPNCGPVQATEQLKLFNLPQNLIIHLKRFACKRTERKKINTPITIPLKNLDVINFLSERCDLTFPTTLYDLIGFVCHAGSLDHGHYICYVKDHQTGQWYKYDDTIVETIDEEQIRKIIEEDGKIRNFQPYILFYQLKS